MRLPRILVEEYKPVVQALPDKITTLKVNEAAPRLEEVKLIVRSCRREQKNGKVGSRRGRLLVGIDKELAEAVSLSM